jgi:hypothetical protein
MTNEEIQQLKKALAVGKNNGLAEIYKGYYEKITGKRRYGGRCSSCEINFLFQFLSSYIKTNKL